MLSSNDRMWISDISLSCRVQDRCLCASNWREKIPKKKGHDKVSDINQFWL